MFLSILEGRIRQDLKLGLLISRPGCGVATIACEYYLNSLLKPPSKNARTRLKDLKRLGGRWREFALPSALLLLIHTDVAERFVYVPTSFR